MTQLLTKHFIHRAKERGVSAQAILNTLVKGRWVDTGEAFIAKRNNVRVIISYDNKLVTVYKKTT